MSNIEHFLWVEKYRPSKIDDAILPKEIKGIFKGYLSQGRIPHMILSGSAGTGKTTAAKALCSELGVDWIMINGSNENGIDVLRTKITQFASTVSFSDAKKVVIIDEADYLNANSIQPALRSFMEEYSSNCTFILTCNYKNRLIQPLHSRCTVVDYKIPTAEKSDLAAQFFKRVCSILEQEGIEYERKVVAELVQKNFPDFRSCLNALQSYSASGKIDSGILLNVGDESFKALFAALKGKKFQEMRKWVSNNSDMDTTTLFNEFYTRLDAMIEPAGLPSVVLALADYQYKASFVSNQEINTTAFFTEIMLSSNIVWK